MSFYSPLDNMDFRNDKYSSIVLFKEDLGNQSVVHGTRKNHLYNSTTILYSRLLCTMYHQLILGNAFLQCGDSTPKIS